MTAGRPVFVEPSYRRTAVWLRNVRTFLKLHVHALSLLSRALGANQSLVEFLERTTRRPVQPDEYSIPVEGMPSLPFSDNWRAQLAIFEDFAQTARAQGATLVVAARSSREYRYLAASLLVNPIPGFITVDLQQVGDEQERNYHFPKDGHYNALGHEKAATILFDVIVERDLLKLERVPQRKRGNRG
jgi:hypothetical protein